MMTPKTDTGDFRVSKAAASPAVCVLLSLRMLSDRVCVQVHEVIEALAELM